MDPTLDLASKLIQRPSVTPDDQGCQALIAERLCQSGFTIRHLPFGPVSNLWASHGTGTPTLVLAGHSDVVPPGPEARWSIPPYAGMIRDGWLYGRGACDMKGALAAMAEAAVSYVGSHPAHAGTLALLVTSDEEGPAIDGTSRVLGALREQGISLTGAIIGEPSSRLHAGDAIRVGRRGSLGGQIRIEGTAGHVGYVAPEHNAVHQLVHFLTRCMAVGAGREDGLFPPLSFHVTAIEATSIGRNVVPAEARASFNLRYPPALTGQKLEHEIEALAREIPAPHELHWRRSADPYLSFHGRLRTATCTVLERRLGQPPELRVDGGTSDGRFLAAFGCEVVELGLPSERLHAFDERAALSDLLTLSDVYREIVMHYLEGGASGA